VALLWVATYLPWAVSQSGALIMLQSIGVSAPSSSNGMTALQFADDVIGALLVCSLGLLFFNAILSGLHWLMGGGCFGGCAVSLFYPILLALVVALAAVIAIAAGFGGYGPLSQLPLVSSYGLGGLGAAHYELGYYTWYTGLIVNAAGMFGEFVVWRR
ncbi:MAG: hypothetical protein KGO05_02320, partial [Chloroflexota bacterium]|nr:hypothetical protein [Chloroflexota bacterium]